MYGPLFPSAIPELAPAAHHIVDPDSSVLAQALSRTSVWSPIPENEAWPQQSFRLAITVTHFWYVKPYIAVWCLSIITSHLAPIRDIAITILHHASATSQVHYIYECLLQKRQTIFKMSLVRRQLQISLRSQLMERCLEIRTL